MDDATHGCSAYCTADIQAMLLTARAGVTPAVFAEWAACFGYVLHEARRALEVDLATEQAKQTYHWDPVTWERTPYHMDDALPTDEVWMVRVSMAAAVVPVDTPGEGRRPPSGTPWRRLWRAVCGGGIHG